MTELVPANLDARIAYAKALAPSDLLPKQYRNNPANCLIAIEYGQALGLAPMAAIQGIHVVEGKPTASAQLIGALVRNAGHRLRVTADDTHAVAVIIRADDPDFEFRSEWTMERAKTAGLAGKHVWKQYPAAMLKARAITEVARDACPEVLSGVAYTTEELGHNDTTPTINTARIVPPAAPNTTTVNTETGEIIDAEVVEDDTPDAALGITPAQSRKLFALLRELGVDERDSGLEMISNILGHDVDSTKTLSKSDASMVIDTLTHMADQT